MMSFGCGFRFSASLRSATCGKRNVVVRASEGEVPRGEKVLYSRTDPESYVTEWCRV